MSTLDDCLELILQGSVAFAAGSVGFFYLSDHAKVLRRWYHLARERRASSSEEAEEEEEEEEEAARLARREAGGRRVTRVVVRSGALVDGVTFFYAGAPSGVLFGGNGGTEQAPFELGEDEWIVEVRGQRGAYIDQIQFVTNTGRASPPYGGTSGEPFAFRLPDNGAVGGLDVAVSINGWLRSIRGVIDVHKVNLSPPETPLYVREQGIVRAHRARVRRRHRALHLTLIMYTAFLIFAASSFVLDLLRGPEPLHPSHHGREPTRGFVSLETTREEPLGASSRFWDGEKFVRWVILTMDKEGPGDPRTLGMLVKEVLERTDEPRSDKPMGAGGRALVRKGIVRRYDVSAHGLGFDLVDSPSFQWLWSQSAKPQEQQRHAAGAPGGDGEAGARPNGHIPQKYPLYYIDESFSPMFTWLLSVLVLGIFSCAAITEWKQAVGVDDPVIERFKDAHRERNSEDIARDIDAEILEESTLVLPWSSSIVAVTRNWLIKTKYFGLDAIAIDDARLVDLRVSGRWIMGELVEIVTLRIESRRSVTHSGHHRGRATYFFDVALPRMQFESLQASFIDRVNKRQEEQVRKREAAFTSLYDEMLCSRAADGICFDAGEFSLDDECLGACGRKPAVQLDKRCDTCEERQVCSCEPSWCHRCLLKWWFTRNRTRVEIASTEEGIDPTWQAQCPTCRVYFCLNDVVPRRDISDLLAVEDPDQEGLAVPEAAAAAAAAAVEPLAQPQTPQQTPQPRPPAAEQENQEDATPQAPAGDEDGSAPAAQPTSGEEAATTQTLAQRRARAAEAAERRRVG